MFQAMVRDAKGAVNQILYWSRPVGLEESVSDAEPRHHLLHAFLQHEGRRSHGARDPAGG